MGMNYQEKKNRIVKSPPGSSIDVRFYEGYKSRQVPRSVCIGKSEHLIVSVLSRKREFDQEKDMVFEIFRCKLDDGSLVEIKVGLHGGNPELFIKSVDTSKQD